MKKGQYLTVESVFFFAMGVVMTVTIFFTFLGISDNLKKDNMKAQLEKVGEFVRSNIVSIFLVGNTTNSTINFEVKIPEQISGCIYQIIVDNNLEINCTDNGIGNVLNLYGIKTTIRNRVAYSSSGKLDLSYKDGMIELND